MAIIAHGRVKWINYSPPGPSPTGTFNEQDGFVRISADQQQAVELAFRLRDDLTNLRLEEVSDDPNAQITFAYSSKTQDHGTNADRDLVDNPGGGSNRLIQDSPIWSTASGLRTRAAILDSAAPDCALTRMRSDTPYGLSHPGTYNAADAVSPTYAGNAEYSRDR